MKIEHVGTPGAYAAYYFHSYMVVHLVQIMYVPYREGDGKERSVFGRQLC